MNVLFFIFKLIFSPVKSIYTMMTGKKRKTHFLLKPLKICLIVVLIIFSVGAIIASFNEQDLFVGTWRENGTSIIPVEVDLTDIDEELLEENPDGTVNGLNLQLIDSIQTEGFVKEYLTIARKSEKGELDDLEVHATVSAILGTQIAEGNTSNNGVLPKTFLPLSSSGEQYWGSNNPYGVSANLFNLTNADYNFYTDGGGSVPTSDIPRSNQTGTYYGPFQQTLEYFGMYGGHYPAAKMNPSTKSGTRKSDPFYFPDQVVGLSWELTAAKNEYSGVDMTATQLAAALSMRHNAGGGSFSYQILHGVHWKSGLLVDNGEGEETSKSLKLLFDDFSATYEKRRNLLAINIEDHLWKFIALLMMLEDGWKVDPGRNYSYITTSNKNNIIKAYQILYPGTSDSDAYAKAQQLISSNTASFSAPHSTAYGRTSGPAVYGGITPVIYKIRTETTTNYIKSGGQALPIVHEIPIETAGHVFATSYAGDYMYASMLKYAGVNVDPTDPNSYMNTLPEGEWKPSGDSVWMSNYPEIDQSKLTSKREAFLNEAYKWLGSWYAWGGTNPPVKDSNGEWKKPSPVPGTEYYDPGFDCSRYVQYCAQVALGIDITRATPTQQSTSMMEDITRDEAKPGDLVYCYPAGSSTSTHVYIYLGKTSDGFDLMMHAPSSGKTLEIRVMNYPDYYGGGYKYRRIKGIDD